MKKGFVMNPFLQSCSALISIEHRKQAGIRRIVQYKMILKMGKLRVNDHPAQMEAIVHASEEVRFAGGSKKEIYA